MKNSYGYFENDMKIIEAALRSIDKEALDHLIAACENVLRKGGKIIASGLGKNVPVCEKFVGTMLSLGLDAGFLHTNSAVHGDLGMVHAGDLVIILTKSGATTESVYLAELLQQRPEVELWLLSFEKKSVLADFISNKVIVSMEHEGDMWNIVPNNSTILNLIILQVIAMELSKRMELTLEKDFKPNHPGGAIGAKLQNK